MSPYIFVLVMEYLSRVLKNIRKTPAFSFHPKCSRMGLENNLFADDLMMV